MTISITVDGRPVEVADGATVLDAVNAIDPAAARALKD